MNQKLYWKSNKVWRKNPKGLKKIQIIRTISCNDEKPKTCSWHIFTNSESTNPRIFLTKNILFSFKEAAKCLFFVKINSFSNIFDLSRKKSYLVLKEKQEKFCEKNSCILGFGIRENMSRTGYNTPPTFLKLIITNTFKLYHNGLNYFLK